MIQPKDLVVDFYEPPAIPDFEITLPKAIEQSVVVPRLKLDTEPNKLDRLVGELNKGKDPLLWQVAPNEIKPWRDNIATYSPYVDMADAYAKADPFTMGDVLEKTFRTGWNHLGASYSTLYGGVKELLKGNTAGFWGNEYSKAIAEANKNLEELLPLYTTKDERDNPWALRNLTTTGALFLPSLGTVGATMADIAIGHLIATGVGTLAGPGGIAATNMAAFAKDSVALRGMFQAIFSVGKAIQGTSIARGLAASATAAKIGTQAKLGAAALFWANGEAALQAELNSQSYVEKKKQEYFATHGVYPTGAVLEEITNTAKNIGHNTYALNLPLVAFTQLKQFGTLFLGKAFPKLYGGITDKLRLFTSKSDDAVEAFFARNKVLNTATVKNKSLWSRVKEQGLDMFSEGFEEFSQSVIDSAVTNHYDPLLASKYGLVGDLLQTGYKHAQTSEGLMDFAGGAFIGGLTGGAMQVSDMIGSKKRAQAIATEINTSTQALYENTVKNEYHAERLAEAFRNQDIEAIDSITRQAAYSFAQSANYTGTINARLDYLNSMKEMDIQEFNNQLGTDLTQEDRDVYIDTVVSQVKKASEILDDVNESMGTPGFLKGVWIKNLLSKTEEMTGKEQKELLTKVFNDAKSIIAYNIFSRNELGETVQLIDSLLPIKGLIDSNVKASVSKYKADQKVIANANLVGNDKLVKHLEELDKLGTIEQYEKILEYNGVDKDLVAYGLRAEMARRIHEKDLINWQTPTGQKELISMVADYVGVVFGKKEIQQQETLDDNQQPDTEQEAELPEEQPAQPVEATKEPSKEESQPKQKKAASKQKAKDDFFDDTEPLPTDVDRSLFDTEEVPDNLRELAGDDYLTISDEDAYLMEVQEGTPITMEEFLGEVKGTKEQAKKEEKVDPKTLPESMYNKLPIETQFENPDKNKKIQVPGKYIILQTDDGMDAIAAYIVYDGKDFKAFVSNTDAITFKKGVWKKVNLAVSNKQYRLRDLKELSAVAQREAGQRPSKDVTQESDYDKYVEELREKLDIKSTEYTTELKYLESLHTNNIIKVKC